MVAVEFIFDRGNMQLTSDEKKHIAKYCCRRLEPSSVAQHISDAGHSINLSIHSPTN